MTIENPQVLTWKFPLPEPGCGVLLGNGKLGMMVWGEDRLCLTISRNGFWDRRGGALPKVGATFRELKRLLEAGDHQAVLHLFTEEGSGDKVRPTQLPCGRLELVAEGWRPESAELDLPSGTLKVWMTDAAKQRAGISIGMSRDLELTWIQCDPGLGLVSVSTVPMWHYLSEELIKIGCKAPAIWNDKNHGGMCQELPEDPALALAWRWHDRTLVTATALGKNPRPDAEKLAQTSDLAPMEIKAASWWKDYWRDIPRLSLPDPGLQHAYLYGVFQQAGLTPPEGVAATLVGPWMEEMYFPAWCNDYHFNINAQLIYWPCLATNRTSHLGPLWDMIRDWIPRLRQNAQRFFEIDDGLMLPHAVNDHGKTVDNFWAGLIDHACTAWMALLAWLHYRYSMDDRVLRETAWPLLLGAFNGYWAMLEEHEESGRKRLSLPITVSPEYLASNGKAWGANASFQLAALHMVASILPRAARLLGEQADARWARIREELPPYTTTTGNSPTTGEKVRRVALWEGQDLEFSHRHHSHLALIYPFATVDMMSEEHREVMSATLQHWIGLGPGLWSGWSQPWTATICTRCDLPDAAIAWLHWWRDVYTNIGHGSDHNGDFAGCNLSNRGYLLPQDPDARYRPIIQLDGAMGVITAILEILVQCRGDLIVVLPRIPRRWTAFSFDGIATEGAFLVGATIENGLVVEIRITSQVGGPLRLRHSLGDSWQVNGKSSQGNLWETATTAGQQFILKRQ